MLRNILLTLLCFFLLAGTLPAHSIEDSPPTVLEKELPLLGHRNWIVIADSAYPLQSNPGIRTYVINDSQENVLKSVLSLLSSQKHVKPLVYTDAELEFVSPKHAPGISSYREALKSTLGKLTVQVLPHEDIIAKLDKAGSTFNVLIFKTNSRLPYSSVFIELDCAYWTEQAEKDLRNAMKNSASQ